jgi:hypothetical protein
VYFQTPIAVLLSDQPLPITSIKSKNLVTTFCQYRCIVRIIKIILKYLFRQISLICDIFYEVEKGHKNVTRLGQNSLFNAMNLALVIIRNANMANQNYRCFWVTFL